MRLGHTLLLIALGSSIAAPAAAIPPGEDGRALRRAATQLGELQVEEAARTIDALARRHPDDADVRFERAMLRFYRGQYEGAVLDLDAAGDRTSLRSPQDREDLAALIRSTREATRSFVTERSSDGRFEVSHAPGPDALLVPYAIEAMSAADRAIGEELGARPPGPIRLEIYPTAASLAEVSSLTVREIETTGTIALCKWDRLMVTTPRALVRGYPWMDTIGHELVHLYLSRTSRDRAPVWLQEGVAKFLERRWRGDPPEAHLDPASEAMLTSAAREGRLLPFDRLHPSIARLPSQQDAALAFAQVATFVEGFYQAHGRRGLQEAVRRIADGEDAREAIAAVAGESFAALEASWQASLRERAPPSDPPRMLALRLRRSESGAPDESGDVDDARAARHLRLGDLLWNRRRPLAASVEYGRAHEHAPDDPIVASRLARAAVDGGAPERAAAVLERFRERYPEHAPTWALSGAAWLALDRREDAERALLEAIRINPFDPRVHCDLADAAAPEALRSRARAACRALGGPGQRGR